MKNSFYFDVDGTLALENEPIGESVQLFNKLVSNQNNQVRILTNNTSRSINSTVEKLSRLGLKVDRSNVISPQRVFIEYVRSNDISEVFLISNNEFSESLNQDLPTLELASKNPKAVVVGFDTELTYDKLVLAGEFLQRGTPLWALHMDKFCPTKSGGIPDCGSIVALLQTAYSVEVEKDFGKPGRLMTNFIMKDTIGYKTYVIGDRLSTDILLGKRIGAHAVLVLTGEGNSTSESKIIPDEICADVNVFINKFV